MTAHCRDLHCGSFAAKGEDWCKKHQVEHLAYIPPVAHPDHATLTIPSEAMGDICIGLADAAEAGQKGADAMATLADVAAAAKQPGRKHRTPGAPGFWARLRRRDNK